ncbi:hypothetical protein ABE41_017095 [Fictibacillus arsenicus]|uniref:Uncharacterized protein n=1 Tax=Fictibacillus arsenicus TaxID=255247 RepID=A0A1B1Z8D8_9BACL|nr:hypothetical protein [Fictibacillus arsenicus]ANX13728.1 hypothetical protein ABE41_017095 [Fictibacillus arsenicus]
MRKIVLFGISVICVLVSLIILIYSIGRTSLVGIAVFPLWIAMASFDPVTGESSLPIAAMVLFGFELLFVYMNFYFIKTVLKWSISFSNRLKNNIAVVLNALSFISIVISVLLVFTTLTSNTPNGFVIYGALQPAYKYEETNLFLSNLWVIFTFLSAAFLIYLNIRFIKWLRHKMKENNVQTVEQK